MNNPKISVIMSVYNEERFLREAIDSVLEQGFKNFELIIIDDASNDASLEIIREYEKRDSRIVLIENKKNLGCAKARNKGLRVAKGDYIAILDANDISLEDRFETQVHYLKKNKKVFLVGGGAYNINEEGDVISCKEDFQNSEEIAKKLLRGNCIYHPTIMFRNERDNFYREKFIYAQDYDFYLILLSKNKKLKNLKKILVKWRIVASGISCSNKSKQSLFAEKAKEFYKQRLDTGKDEYDEFDPDEILNIDVETTKNKIVLESEMKVSFKLNDFCRVRRFSRRYFKYYGIINKFLFYYLLSFMGKRFVSIIRKLFFISQQICKICMILFGFLI